MFGGGNTPQRVASKTNVSATVPKKSSDIKKKGSARGGSNTVLVKKVSMDNLLNPLKENASTSGPRGGRSAKEASKDVVTIPTAKAIKSDPSAVNDLLTDMAAKALIKFDWYHGLIPRDECPELIKNNGDYLVRKTTVKNKASYAVSVKHDNLIRHFNMTYDTKNGWQLSSNTITHQGATIDELLDKLVSTKTPIGGCMAVLRTPVPRPDYYILHENIQLEKKLGAGAFGEVFSGKLKKDNIEVKVAVKRIKTKVVNKSKLAVFVKEATLMRRLNHRNCIRLYGIAPHEEPFMIILELATGGEVKKYLKDHNPPNAEILRLLTDGARGMCYLSQRQVIHRDLAARNCLLSEHNELKISDFGLSVSDTSELRLAKLEKVPVKWLAPESLMECVFNTKTDVWSFGVLAWEMVNRCKADPFPGMSNAEAKNLILGTGDPLSPPADAPPIIGAVMHACFNRDIQKRADFVQVLKMLAPEEIPPLNSYKMDDKLPLPHV